MESSKQAAANAGASARAGLEKTRAAVQGQADKAAAYAAAGGKEAAEVNKEAAEVRKQQRVRAAEEEKKRAVREHASTKEERTGTEGNHHPSPHDAPEKDGRDEE